MFNMNGPTYYEKFKCIANECSFTCCQQWRIAVDEKTYEEWKQKQIDGIDGNLSDYSIDGAIALNEKRVCPLLDENRLCKVVSKFGEEMISTTCHTFPRETHSFEDEGYEEKTLTMSCPAALDLLWEYGLVLDDTAVDGELGDLLWLREKCMEQIRCSENTIEEAMLICFFVLLDLDEQPEADIRVAFHEDFLSELKTAIAQVERDPFATFMECNELFLDLSENYRNKGMYQSILEPLAVVAEEFESLTEENFEAFSTKVNSFKTELSKYERQLRLLIEEEIYSTMVLPESDLYSMLIKLQWISLTYATIRHCLFIAFYKEEKLSIEKIKEIIVMILRMTGYSEADMEEYLENCFEEIIWDWGYMALIL